MLPDEQVSQIQSLKIRRSTNLKLFKNVDGRILKLWTFEMFGQVSSPQQFFEKKYVAILNYFAMKLTNHLSLTICLTNKKKLSLI